MKVINRTLLALTAFSLAGIVQAGNASGQSYINYFVAGSTYNSGLPEYPSVPGQPGLKLTNFHSGITLTFNALKGAVAEAECNTVIDLKLEHDAA